MNTKNILILFSFRSHKTGYIERLFARLQEKAPANLLLSRGSLKDMQVSITNNSLSVVESLTSRPLDDFDAIYFELWYKAQQQALAVATYASRHRIPYFSREVADILPMTKLGELSILADHGLPLPDSFSSSQRETLRVFKKTPPLQFPLVMKAIDGYGGQKNFLVHSYADIKRVYATHPTDTFVLQRFIPNDCDYRLLILGGEVAFILKRTRTSEQTHLNNTSQGAEGEVVDLESFPSAIKADALKAATLLNRREFAGVDILVDKETQQHYILEVNQTPQIEIGAVVDQKVAALLNYIDRIAKGGGNE